jgi:L-alanine-DL-glutamate epimerase-like enolase superfamily enzyme
MISPTVIRSARVAPLDIPLHVPFGIAGGAQPAANNVLFTVELADGTRGYGEAAPLPPYNGETQADAMAALGEEFSTTSAVRSGSARCALEAAVLDALTRSQRLPLWKYFAGSVARETPAELETDMTVTTGTAEEAAVAAREIRARGIRMIKVKVGGAKGAAHDLERVEAIHRAAPDAPLILDGNAGVSRDATRELVRGLKARGIAPALLEQWLAKDDLAGMRALREESGWLVAADEAVNTAADVERIAAQGAADVVNIKLMKAGVAAGLDVAQVARARGLGLMIGGNVESMLAMTVSACFAAGLGGFQFADLDTPFFLAENPFSGGYAISGGTISVRHIAAGHGVNPK